MQESSASPAATVDRLADARVVCVGDVMVDRFVRGEVERISPEAPVPVCRVVRTETMLGGAGNVARNVAALGARVTLVGAIGADDLGREVPALCRDLPHLECALFACADRTTTLKVRYTAGGHQLLRADHECSDPVPPAAAAAILESVRERLRSGDVLLLSDYAKGALTPGLLQELIALARGRGCAVVVDPKGPDYRRYAGATVVTPNARELALAAGRPVRSDADVELAARELIARCSIEQVLCTRGAEGASLVTATAVSYFPAEAREVFDVSGAGDTVAAVLAAALGAGLPVAEAALLANTAAGLAVGKAGTAPVHADELAAALRARDMLSAGYKVVTTRVAAERVRTWRARGLRVGFANGCFDLLHPGHLALLAQARAACDRLVVGLNSDASVRRLKGPERPVQSEAARALVLSSLGGVDLVVVFDEDTPASLIEALRPDLLVKGADYRVEQVVGAEFVRGYGGRVLLADLSPGHSTTGTIARLRAL